MVESGTAVLGVEMWTVNTDAQALSRSLAPHKLNIGTTTSRGLGAGGSPDVGHKAAEESREDISRMVADSDLVFVTAGMGGGTGSGAAPVVADCARKAGALTVGVVTKPFAFEGRKRLAQANQAIVNLKDQVDTLIVVSNDKLLEMVPENTPLTDAFLVADDILRQGVVGISEIIIKPGLVNVDFADVRAIMGHAGTALMGIGHGKGKNRAQDAALAAISSPLLDVPISKAKGVVFNIVGGEDVTLQEINAAAEIIYQNVDQDANIIFGALVDDKITNGEMTITVLATGFATDFYQSPDQDFKQKSADTSNVDPTIRLPEPAAPTPTSLIPPEIEWSRFGSRAEEVTDSFLTNTRGRHPHPTNPFLPHQNSPCGSDDGIWRAEKRTDVEDDDDKDDNNGDNDDGDDGLHEKNPAGIAGFFRRLLNRM
jgi:cell division protein FtsZ